jgi:NTE family protein
MPHEITNMHQPRITLALGGGGARGAAHLGVIQAITEADLRIDQIVGVSIGALMGAAYAAQPDIEAVQQRMLQFLMSPSFQKHQTTMFGTRSAADGDDGGMFGWYDRIKDYMRATGIFHRVINHTSMLPGILLNDVVSHLVPEMDIRATKIPLAVVAVDLIGGHRIVLERGSLRTAVKASASLPGIFPPVEWNDMLLCDIGVFNSLPAIVAQAYHSDFVIAVDVSSTLKRQTRFDNALDVLMRMDEVGETLYRQQIRNTADLLICPDVRGTEWFDFSSSPKLIENGLTAGRKAIRGFLEKWKRKHM